MELRQFGFTRLDERFGFVSMSPRLGVVVKSLNPKRTKDGRDFDIVAAYFGFTDEVSARQFAGWVERRCPQGGQFRALATVRKSERLETGWEVKVTSFPQVKELIGMALDKEQSRVVSEREARQSLQQQDYPLVNRNAGRTMVGAGNLAVGID